MIIQLLKPRTGARYLMMFSLIMLIVGVNLVLAAPDKGNHRREHVVGAKHRTVKKGSAKSANRAAGPSWEDVDDGRSSRNYNSYDRNDVNRNNVNNFNNVNAANEWPNYGQTPSYSTLGTQQPSTPYNTFTNPPTFGAPIAARSNSPMKSGWAGSASPSSDSAKYDALLSDPFMGTAAGYQSSSPGNVLNPFLSSVYQSNQIAQNAYRNPMFSGGTRNSYQSGPNGYHVLVKGLFNGIHSYLSRVFQSSSSNYQYSKLGNSAWAPNNLV